MGARSTKLAAGERTKNYPQTANLKMLWDLFVVYFDQRLGAVHSNSWMKFFFHVLARLILM